MDCSLKRQEEAGFVGGSTSYCSYFCGRLFDRGHLRKEKLVWCLVPGNNSPLRQGTDGTEVVGSVVACS